MGSEEPWRRGLLRSFLASLRIHPVKSRPYPAWREPRGSAPQKPGKGFSLSCLRYATRKKNGCFACKDTKTPSRISVLAWGFDLLPSPTSLDFLIAFLPAMFNFSRH